jgi:glucosamine--fructose-6-phosphate aminotransferase (isomerizing)
VCTISGLIFFGDKCLETLESFKKVIVKGEMRGIDATGISIIYYDGSIKSIKLALKASDVEERIFEFLKSNVNDLTYAVLVNNRAQPLPEGSSKDNLNNIQPVIKDNLICIHNGTVSNDRALRDKYGYTQETQIDSEVFIDLYRQFVAPADSRINGWQEILKEVAGGFALSLVDPQ